jgi:hypothetical protein
VRSATSICAKSASSAAWVSTKLPLGAPPPPPPLPRGPPPAGPPLPIQIGGNFTRTPSKPPI